MESEILAAARPPPGRVCPRHERVARAEQTQLGDHHRDRADPRRRGLGIEERDLDLHRPGTSLVYHLIPFGERLLGLPVEEIGELLLILRLHLAWIAPEEAHHDDCHLVVLGEHALGFTWRRPPSPSAPGLRAAHTSCPTNPQMAGDCSTVWRFVVARPPRAAHYRRQCEEGPHRLLLSICCCLRRPPRPAAKGRAPSSG